MPFHLFAGMLNSWWASSVAVVTCCIAGRTACGDVLAWPFCSFAAPNTVSCTQGWGNLEEVSDGCFLEWARRSQLYSGDVLAPQALQDLTAWMAEAAPGDKRQMMALLRDLHATISPTGSALHPYLMSNTSCICC